MKNLAVSRTTLLAAILFFLLGYFFSHAIESQVGQLEPASIQSSSTGDPFARPAVGEGAAGNYRDIAGEVREMEEAIRVDSANPIRFTDLGHLYFEQKNQPMAWRAYARAVELGGPTPERLIGLARASLWYQRYDAAENYLMQALRMEPGNPDVLYQLGLFHFHNRNDRAKALQYWRQYLAVAENGPTALEVSLTIQQMERMAGNSVR